MSRDLWDNNERPNIYIIRISKEGNKNGAERMSEEIGFKTFQI